jgi:integrase
MQQQPTQGAFTAPEISIANAKDWFIYFRFTHQGKEYLRKYREGINRIDDKRERMIKAEEIRQKYAEWLETGWNPIADPEFKLRLIRPSTVKQAMYLKEAIAFALSKKKLAKKSKLGYSSMLNFINAVAVKHGYDLLPIAEYDRGVCLSLIDECSKERDFSNHNYNKHVSVLRTVFSELLDYRMLNVNPLLDYKDREVPESNLYQDYTEDEKKRIADHLLEVHPQLFTVMSVIYHTGIRPKEVLSLKVKDMALEELTITIAPVEGKENSKTKNVRKVPVNPHLYELLKAMELDKYPDHYYVFGTPLKRNKGCQKLEDGRVLYGAMRTDYLQPNEFQIKRDTITKLWKRLIIDEPPTGLGIEKYLYAAKHTGTDDKTDQGLDLKDIQVMYGHASEAMTARYNKRKRENEAKREILEKSPAFSKERG